MFQLAARLKLNAPRAHTWLEIVAARWGTTAHLVFMFFGCATHIRGWQGGFADERLADLRLMSSYRRCSFSGAPLLLRVSQA